MRPPYAKALDSHLFSHRIGGIATLFSCLAQSAFSACARWAPYRGFPP
jgi:hypothetical protein